MRVVARRTGQFAHDVEARGHRVVADEPEDRGGGDTGLNPHELLAGSLAACTAITMEMYAARKSWDLDGVVVECEYEPAERGAPARFGLVLRLPAHLTDEQVERLRVIAAKCPIHRTLDGEVVFDERVELVD